MVLHIHLFTFVTKYSRLPSEEIEQKRYYSVWDNGRNPVILNPNWYLSIVSAFDIQAKKNWVHILACTILPDHVHIIIDIWEKNISDVVSKIKWYSSYVYNHTCNHLGAVRARWYSDTYLDNKNHLKNAIIYVQNNHLKHQEKRGNVRANENLQELFSSLKKRYQK